MPLPPENLSDLPAVQQTHILPNGVALVTMVNATVSLNFRFGRTPDLNFPSVWRLAKHVVYERGPLLAYRYRDQA